MRKKEFILNGKTGIMIDGTVKGAMKLEWYNVQKMQKALTALAEAGQMSSWDLRQARNVLKDCARPIVQRMKQLAPKSSRMTSLTMHRSMKKGQATTITRKHSAGELRRSIGVIARSRKYRTIPLVYVGVRRGVRYASSGYHAEVVEHGRKAMTARSGKFLFFANKDGSVVKKKTVAGFAGRKFFKRAMDATADQALSNAMDSFAFWFGGIWERGGVKQKMKKV